MPRARLSGSRNENASSKEAVAAEAAAGTLVQVSPRNSAMRGAHSSQPGLIYYIYGALPGSARQRQREGECGFTRA